MTDYLLDTDTVSFALRGEGDVAANLLRRRPSQLALSSLSLAELRFGAEKRRSKKLHGLIDVFVANVDVLPFDSDAADRYGKLSALLRSRGTPIGVLDTMIAAHALALGRTLVTNNTKHFARVSDLHTESWR